MKRRPDRVHTPNLGTLPDIAITVPESRQFLSGEDVVA